MKTLTLFALSLGIATTASAQFASKGITPTVSGSHSQKESPDAAKTPSIVYHGGPVLGTVVGRPVHLYYIFYGDWATIDPGGTSILTDFGNSLGGSPYWNILTSYITPSGAQIHNSLTLAGTTTDLYSQGKTLTDATLATVVQSAISSGRLPLDGSAVYHVLTTKDVTESGGFCSAYCGFHTHMSFQGKDIKYSFVGNPEGCVQQGGVADCQGEPLNVTASPNNDPGVDAMISVLAHESEEATSDPDLNAWYFRTGAENGDQCAYMYGTEFPVGGGNPSKANVTMGSRNYLIQQNWIAPNKGCALSF